jgi:hypothetical protein
MVVLQGIATRLSDGALFSFGSIVTINDNRLPVSSNPAQPGLNPICKQRIVRIGEPRVTPVDGGRLTVTVDPRGWFQEPLDFSTLPPTSALNPCQLDPGSSYTNPITDGGAACGVSGNACCPGAGGTAEGTCHDPFVCLSGGVCGAAWCVPDTNYATGAGATQGGTIFNGIQTAGAAAYTLELAP